MAALAESVGLEQLSLAGLPLPLTVRLPVPLTDRDLIAFSERNKPYRIERNEKGELEILTPVGGRGSTWEARAIGRLGEWAEEHGGVVFSSNAGFTLSDGSVRSPDAAWIKEERWNALTSEEQEGYPPICPEFLIEVLSKHDSRPVLEAKMAMWISNGAMLAWMIDPFARSVSIYRVAADVQVLDQPDAVVAEEVVTGFRLELARLWNP
jgi:Uma2 family endonuclease